MNSQFSILNFEFLTGGMYAAPTDRLMWPDVGAGHVPLAGGWKLRIKEPLAKFVAVSLTVLTGGESEGGPRPTLRRTHNSRGLVGWALAHLQSSSRILGDSESDVTGSGAARRVAYFVEHGVFARGSKN
jgi:hypothetical protein